MAENDLKVIVKAKELAFHTFKLTANGERFPKKHRFCLCKRLQDKCIDIFEALFEANRINNKTNRAERCEKITEAITLCDELLFLIELSMDVANLSKSSAEYWSKMVSDVKFMSIAWRKSERQ